MPRGLFGRARSASNAISVFEAQLDMGTYIHDIASPNEPLMVGHRETNRVSQVFNLGTRRMPWRNNV
jgi:hypothetical protein